MMDQDPIDFLKEEEPFLNGELSLCRILNGRLSPLSIRTRLSEVPLIDSDDCFKAVAEQYITGIYQNMDWENDERYQEDFNDLRNVLRTVSDDRIHRVLQSLGPIEERSFVALKLLIHKKKKICGPASQTQKRKIIEDEVKINGQEPNKIPKCSFQTEETKSVKNDIEIENNQEFDDQLSPSLFAIQSESSSESTVVLNYPNHDQVDNIENIQTKEDKNVFLTTEVQENSQIQDQINNIICSQSSPSEEYREISTNQNESSSDQQQSSTTKIQGDMNQISGESRESTRNLPNNENQNSIYNKVASPIYDEENVCDGNPNVLTSNSPTKIVLKRVKTGSSLPSYVVKVSDACASSVSQNDDVGEKLLLPKNETDNLQDSKQNGEEEKEQLQLNNPPQIRPSPDHKLLPIHRNITPTELHNALDRILRNAPETSLSKQTNSFKTLDRATPQNPLIPRYEVSKGHKLQIDDTPRHKRSNDSTFPKNQHCVLNYNQHVPAQTDVMNSKRRRMRDIPATIVRPTEPIILLDEQPQNNDNNDGKKKPKIEKNEDIPSTIVKATGNLNDMWFIDFPRIMSEIIDVSSPDKVGSKNNPGTSLGDTGRGKRKGTSIETVIIDDSIIISEPDVINDNIENANNNIAINDAPSTATAEKTIVDPIPPIDEKLFYKVIEMFPSACPDYIRGLCGGKVWSELAFDEIITELFSTPEYPQRTERPPSPELEVNVEDQMAMLEAMLPECDPTYLRLMLDRYGSDQNKLQTFLDDAINNKIKYPSRKDYLKKLQICAQQMQYTINFRLEKFIEIFPDPVQTFEDSNRKGHNLNAFEYLYLKNFLRNLYRRLSVRVIDTCLKTHKDAGLHRMIKYLEHELAIGNVLKTARYITPNHHVIQNIPLLQEIAYFEHKQDILKYIETKKKEAEKARENARAHGLLQECQCCYDAEVMPQDILECQKGCKFCRDCIKKSTEVILGDGKVDFPCLLACGAEFSMLTLQDALPPKMFSILGQKKAAADIAAAGIEDLEKCPFCDFASIPAPGDKLFRCLNPECMKESCRECKEPSHVPLRCDEVEKDEDVKARTAIENKMTEALIRECWKCHKKFIKLEGCNKMTCSCGALMCYVCRQPVKDYKHFNGQGGSRTDLCPLYSDNYSVNEQNVLKAAEEAKKEVGTSNLKVDPTADLQDHFSKSKKEHEQYEENQARIQREHQRLLLLQEERLRQARRALEIHQQRLEQQRLHPPPAPAHQVQRAEPDLFRMNNLAVLDRLQQRPRASRRNQDDPRLNRR